ncbi:hypothetical protein WDW89_23920 [Deltaproteobacteria bacterium TL4]
MAPLAGKANGFAPGLEQVGREGRRNGFLKSAKRTKFFFYWNLMQIKIVTLSFSTKLQDFDSQALDSFIADKELSQVEH